MKSRSSPLLVLQPLLINFQGGSSGVLSIQYIYSIIVAGLRLGFKIQKKGANCTQESVELLLLFIVGL